MDAGIHREISARECSAHKTTPTTHRHAISLHLVFCTSLLKVDLFLARDFRLEKLERSELSLHLCCCLAGCVQLITTMPLTVEYSGKKKALPGTPASALAEIFMQACDAFRCDPSSHTLRYKKKALDLTLPLRLANLPAGCVAELCEIDAKEGAARTVQVVLQQMVVCETSGDLVPRRSQAPFPCTKTLWEVLGALEDISGTRLISGCDERGEVPCVSSMNVKKEGRSALETTSLLHLGFVSGSALLKHSFATAAVPVPEEAQHQDLPPAPEQPAPVEEGSAGNAMEVDSTVQEKQGTAVADAGAAEEGAERERSDKRVLQSTDQKLTLKTKMGERLYTVGRPREDVPERSTSDVDVGDDFFELTAADFAVLEAAKKAREKQPAFKTRKMREMEREVKLAAFEDVKIRFIFPNQHFIQGLFSPTETLAHVFDFVRETLVQKDRPFVLSTTPPPTKLVEDDTTFIKYTHLMPSARVYFTWAHPPLEPPYMAFTFISQMQQLEEEEKQKGLKKAEVAESEDGPAASVSARPGDSGGTGDDGGSDKERQEEAGPFLAFSGKEHSLGGEGGASELAEGEEGRRQAAIAAALKRQSASAGKGKASSAQREHDGWGHTESVMKQAPKWFKMA